jgi:hypothetical protein
MKDTSPSAPLRVAGALATDLLGYAVFWLGIVLVFMVAGMVVIPRVGTVDFSLWQGALGFLRWVVLAGGFMVARSYMPLFVAHGITRRHVLVGAAPVVLGLAVAIGAVVAAGFAAEGAVYGVLGWPQRISGDGSRFLYEQPDQYGLIFVGSACSVLAYLLSGALIGASYTRWGGVLGTLFLPVSFLPALVVEVASGGGWFGGPEVGEGWVQSLPVVVALTALVGLAGGAVVAAILRDIPLDNDNVAWWR